MVLTPILIPDQYQGYSIDQLSVPEHYRPYLKDVMIPNGLIRDRLESMAREVHEDYRGKKLHILCVLKGGDKVFGELSKQLEKLNALSSKESIPITFDFVRVSSYHNDRSGEIKITGDLERLQGMHVLLIEDIIDTGKSMTKLFAIIQQHNPASIKVLSLLTKRIPQGSTFTADYVGFSIPNHFVVGYCLDYNEHFRDLPHICVLNANGVEAYRK
jgi:hypoxanthine phosphoribosyltransferase